MDGDGDLDVVSASYNDDKVAWYVRRRDVWNATAVHDRTSGGHFYIHQR